MRRRVDGCMRRTFSAAIAAPLLSVRQLSAGRYRARPRIASEQPERQMSITLSAPLIRDMKEVHALLLGGASAGQLLPRSLSDLYSHTRDFVIARDENGHVAGCCALSIVWEDLAEIRSLFVREDLRGRNIGRLLCEASLDAARAFGIRSVFTLTYKTAFFAHLGFVEVGKDVLPQKIWADCIHCPKFPDCDEIAMRRDV